MNTMRPEYNEKIKFGVLMGPIIYLQNLGLMYRIISPYANLIFVRMCIFKRKRKVLVTFFRMLLTLYVYLIYQF